MRNLYDLYCINVPINDVKTNSLKVEKNDLFVCIKGVNKDRHQYIKDAIKRGASAIVVSKGKNYSVPYIKVKNTKKELINIVNNLYPESKKINLIAVTGTDGKTTVAEIVRNMLGHDICGYIGTNGISCMENTYTSENTTPEIETIYKYLNEFYLTGLKYSSIEVSSEGILHKRIEGLTFRIAIITNFTEDHLNVHKTLNNYLKCKRKIFHLLDKNGVAILNRDDSYYKKFRKICKCKVLTYGKNRYSTLKIINYNCSYDKTTIEYEYNKKRFVIESPLLGKFNVYNLSAAILALIALDYDIKDVKNKIKKIKVPLGRCEFLDYKTNYKVLLDYAHTENGIKNILEYLNKIKKARIITVTGSAGGREKEKRTGMGKVAQALSDTVIYTMDDPREENVLDIISDLIDKANKNYIVEPNRKNAICKALNMAKENDIVAILGKGRDNYMAIGKEKILYSDVLVLDEYFCKEK